MKIKDLLVMIREIVGPDVQVDFRPVPELGSIQDAHYSITPYSFRPKIGKKLVRHHYLDMGQGLLDCLEEIHRQEIMAPNQVIGREGPGQDPPPVG